MNTCVGTCSICGGQVCVPSVWGGIIPPIPTCAQCGAQAAQHGPVIAMRPRPQYTQQQWTTTAGNKLLDGGS